MNIQEKNWKKINEYLLKQAMEIDKIFQDEKYSALLAEVIKTHRKEEKSHKLGSISMAFLLGKSDMLAQIGTELKLLLEKCEGDDNA